MKNNQPKNFINRIPLQIKKIYSDNLLYEINSFHVQIIGLHPLIIQRNNIHFIIRRV